MFTIKDMGRIVLVFENDTVENPGAKNDLLLQNTYFEVDFHDFHKVDSQTLEESFQNP